MPRISHRPPRISIRRWLLASALLCACSEAGFPPEEPFTGSAGAFGGEPDAGARVEGSAGTTSDPDGMAGAMALADVDSGAAGRDGNASGAGGHMAADGSTAGTVAAVPCLKGTVTGSQTVFIGDSFLAAPTSEIAFALEALMQQHDSSAYSPTPRFRQLVGTTMAQIAMQYDTEHGIDPDIKLLIANGGGNDVLVDNRSCLTQAPPANASCKQTVDEALAAAKALMARAEADGVEHIVYTFYPHEPLMGLFQGDAPAINDSLDYAEPLARAVCETSPICTFVSLRDASGDSHGSGYVERGYLKPNDVHPSSAGSIFFARAIWDTMVEHCIAQ